MITTTYRSPLGDIVLAADSRGLTGLWFDGQKYCGSTLSGAEPAFNMETGELTAAAQVAEKADVLESAAPDIAASADVEQVEGHDALSGGDPLSVENPENVAAVAVLERTWAWLNAYFAGQAPQWTPPLHFEGTDFQHAVWVALLEVPYGETISYGELARKVGERLGLMATDGSGTSPRAVGNAVSRNPISVIVPCHRVVGADGALTGYAGGVERKRALLELEAAQPSA